MLVQTATVFVEQRGLVASTVVDLAGVDEHTKHVRRFRVARPLVVHLLANHGELDWLTCGATVQNFVPARRHWSGLALEQRRDVGHFQLLAHRLVRFHVKALNGVGAVHFGQELQKGETEQIANTVRK